ncbi:MAG TPA: hypothetical protein VFB79_01290 [Candidatus Angelobacter sp.]|nr:hypothetical protein [Candidatus Angelobacter sp.]
MNEEKNISAEAARDFFLSRLQQQAVVEGKPLSEIEIQYLVL